MKRYLDLVPLSARVHKRQNRMTILCIVIAVFLVTAVFSVADMMLRTQLDRTTRKNGSWHLEVTGITPEEAAQLVQQPDVVCVGAGAVFNEEGEADYRLSGRRVALYGCDAAFLNLNRSTAFAGSCPQAEGEVLLGKTAARVLGVSSGDTVTLTLPSGEEKTLTVTGIGGIDEGYYGGQYVLMDAYLPLNAFDALLTEQGETLPQVAYDVRYTSAAKAAKARPELQAQYGEDAVRENLNVMGSAGQSSNTAFRTVYGMAAVPIGLVLGTVSSWVVCGALRYGVGGEFETTPVFKLSPAGLLAGAVVGVVTVLLAAQAPARRAASVSPMAAVSGNAAQSTKERHGVRLGGLRVETALGIHHAAAGKKNWLLMTASFALSIVLALGFTAILQFATQLMPSLVPWQPDVLYNGYSNEQVLSPELTQQMREVPGVAQVWGCVGLPNTPASSDKGNIDHVTFCSYNETMMAASKSLVVAGRLADESGAGNEVMTMYNKTNPMRVGDVITVDGVELTIVGAFSQGVFSDDVTIIAPEALFTRMEGEQNYNMVGVQMDHTADEETILRLAAFANDNTNMQDLRENNRQDLGTYYAVRIVLYGFLALIGGISALNIVNSISMSVSAHAKQYGVMRAVGMDSTQVKKMIFAEAAAYTTLGLLVGCGLGLPLHRVFYTRLITNYWGASWQLPMASVGGILAVLVLISFLAPFAPAKRICEQSVTETISAL